MVLIIALGIVLGGIILMEIPYIIAIVVTVIYGIFLLIGKILNYLFYGE